jgi:hypothetical protein
MEARHAPVERTKILSSKGTKVKKDLGGAWGSRQATPCWTAAYVYETDVSPRRRIRQRPDDRNRNTMCDIGLRLRRLPRGRPESLLPTVFGSRAKKTLPGWGALGRFFPHFSTRT